MLGNLLNVYGQGRNYRRGFIKCPRSRQQLAGDLLNIYSQAEGIY